MAFFGDSVVNSHIEVSDLSDDLKESIQEYYLNRLSEVDLKSGVIHWVDSANDLPSLIWLLRFLKKNQPIKIKDFIEMTCVKYPSISEKWLNHKLDQLRKKDLVIREKSDTYCLAANGLNIVPAGSYSASSDIDRALALGRRKW
jgi:hypothetical protein